MSKEICGNFDATDVTCTDCIRNRVQRLNACYVSVRKEKEQKMAENIKVEADKINPSHYKTENGRQAIDEMLLLFGKEAVIGFCKCTAYKYMFRRGRKSGESFEVDTEKMQWYLDKLEELEKGE